MREKKILLSMIVLSLVCACAGQGGLPPLPSKALEIGADINIESINDQTGDVTLQYTLIFKNISDETLEKIILKDFDLPGDIEMDKEYFEITSLASGREKSVSFVVIVKRWGLNPTDQVWTIKFTTRIEKGNTYTEETSSYEVHLFPK